MKILTDRKRLLSVIVIARHLHKNQVDKCGEPYFEHLSRVANNCTSVSSKIVAYLHDSTEDGHITAGELETLGILKDDELWAIKFLDKTDCVYPSAYLKQIKQDPIAREVKIADLIDNSDMSRFYRSKTPVTEKDVKRLEKYKAQLAFLREA